MTSHGKSPNFTELEKTILIELIQNRKDIIENKQNDARNIAIKEEEWKKISDEFNARPGVHNRTLKQFKALWKNMKARTKTLVAKNRREKKKTGGGQETICTDKFSEAITEMLPQQILSLENPFDDDASLHGDEQEEFSDENDNIPSKTLMEMPSTSSASQSTSYATKLGSSADKSTASDRSRYTAGEKRKSSTVTGRQEQVKSRLLEMAEEEHSKKMKILQLKEDVLNLKKQKLQHELKSFGVNDMISHSRSSACDNDNGLAWRPF